MDRSEIVQRWADHGLFDPGADDAEAAAEVIEFFDSLGIEPADLVGTDPSNLIRTVNESRLRPGPRVPLEAAAAATGMPPEVFDRIRRAAGYRDGEAMTPSDVEAFLMVRAANELFSVDELVAFVRVIRAAMAQVADASTAMFRIDVASGIEARGGADVDYARDNARAADLIDTIWVPMRAIFENELIGAVRRSDAARSGAPTSDMTALTHGVGFVDLVGFTPLAGTLSTAELARFVARFEERAFDVVSSLGGRVVKLIGDEVMFVAVEADTVVAIADALVQSFGDEAGARPSGGVVHGQIISRGGDYYGPSVNMAARLASLALPGEILADRASADRATAHEFAPAGRRQLKGFDDPIEVCSLTGPAPAPAPPPGATGG